MNDNELISRCIIISGGDFYIDAYNTFIRSICTKDTTYLSTNQSDSTQDESNKAKCAQSGIHVIACDSGINYCKTYNISIDTVIGDWDSYNGSLDDLNASIVTLPHRKDDPDTMYACRYALELGYNEIHIFGGLGGKRIDHSFANIQALKFLADNNAHGTLHGQAQNLTLLNSGEYQVSYITSNISRIQGNTEEQEDYVSVFAYGNSVTISLTDFDYDVDHYTITNNFPIGTSNEMIKEKGYITVHDNSLLVIYNNNLKINKID